jgi:hypothetical protein
MNFTTHIQLRIVKFALLETKNQQEMKQLVTLGELYRERHLIVDNVSVILISQRR